MLYGRPIRDHLPALLRTHTIRREWTEIRDLREAAMAKRHMRNEQFYNRGTKQLSDLNIGDSVQVQNQHGSLPRRWHTTGRVVEKLDHQQYRVRVDGSNRMTLRNRRFLRKILPVVDVPSQYQTPSPDLVQYHETAPNQANDSRDCLPPTPLTPTPIPPCEPNTYVEPTLPLIVPPSPQLEVAPESSQPQPPAQTPPPVVRESSPPPPILRRSSRVPRPRRALSPQMRGKTHDISNV